VSIEWSPEQIAGHLAEHFAIDTGMRVSHETIYKSLFMQARGVLAKQLQKHLRSRRPIRRNVHNRNVHNRNVHNTVTGRWRSQITDAVSIRHRPAAC
jgi:transposase, IS30 family